MQGDNINKAHLRMNENESRPRERLGRLFESLGIMASGSWPTRALRVFAFVGAASISVAACSAASAQPDQQLGYAPVDVADPDDDAYDSPTISVNNDGHEAADAEPSGQTSGDYRGCDADRIKDGDSIYDDLERVIDNGDYDAAESIKHNFEMSSMGHVFDQYLRRSGHDLQSVSALDVASAMQENLLFDLQTIQPEAATNTTCDDGSRIDGYFSTTLEEGTSVYGARVYGNNGTGRYVLFNEGNSEVRIYLDNVDFGDLPPLVIEVVDNEGNFVQVLVNGKELCANNLYGPTDAPKPVHVPADDYIPTTDTTTPGASIPDSTVPSTDRPQPTPPTTPPSDTTTTRGGKDHESSPVGPGNGQVPGLPPVTTSPSTGITQPPAPRAPDPTTRPSPTIIGDATPDNPVTDGGRTGGTNPPTTQPAATVTYPSTGSPSTTESRPNIPTTDTTVAPNASSDQTVRLR